MPSVPLIVTDAGIAEVINAEASGTAPVKLTEIGLGTGKYTASVGQTALVSEFKRLDTISGGGIGDNVIHVSVTDESQDAYAVHEIGVFTESGTLFAVYAQSQPIIQKAAASWMMLSLDIALVDVSVDSITFGDTNFVLPSATTEMQGIVELATDAEVQAGKDTSRAVTPKGLASRTATETRTGLAEIATQAEVEAGTDDSRIVSPKKLKAVLDGRTATETRTGLIELATDEEVQTGTDTSRAVTPAALASRTATETRTGLVELATTTEVQAGADTSRAVTPKGLASRTATETRTGLAEIATQAEVETGTDDSRIVSPKKLKAAFDGRKATETPKVAGTGAVGISTKYAREDHVHPAQTSVTGSSGSCTGNAATATELKNARAIDGVSFDGSESITHYGTCSTAAATAAKTVTLSSFALVTGARVIVRFTVTNTAANPTLNVNNTGAKAIQYRNAAISAGYLAANRTYEFVYDGSSYELVGDIDTNTTYSSATTSRSGIVELATQAEVDAGTDSGRVVTPATLKGSYLNDFRKALIGSMFYFSRGKLPEGWVIADGSLVLFADYPELKEVYDAGAFSGMLLEATASASDKSTWAGKWVKHAQGTGLYTPRLQGLFLRNGGTQGKYNKPGLPNITGIYAGNALASSSSGAFYASSEKKGNTLNPAESNVPKLGFDASRSNAMYGS